ncbi:hypothetical protein K438DRAFT_1722527 [Mycena galopus ATCC 62051]|nr:hypothetical protein K438DRAFT_1722527 [Mycena galopus ATCC 62051]
MPVTFTVSNHPANSLQLSREYTATDILAGACQDQWRYVDEVLQFGLSNATMKIPKIFPDSQGNGFVNTVLDAYNHHRALVIRPDDVWLTILSQFNLYVNANTELLRANFVAHQGKKELVIYAEGTRYDMDFGAMSRQMVTLIEKNIVDPTLRESLRSDPAEWAMPNFTTTTVNDTTVAAVLMMATLKEYFAYGICCATCGIPRVTLEGDRSDWVNILERLGKLKEYGIETIAWYHLLHPVISGFINLFDAPKSKSNVDFWRSVARYPYPNMCGPALYTGWINAFTVFSKKGAWLGHGLDKGIVSQVQPEDLTAEQFWVTYSKLDARSFRERPYHHMTQEGIPPAYAEVNVKLVDNGKQFDCLVLAGVVGTRVSMTVFITE